MTPKVPNYDLKTWCNIGRLICVACTFHLRWALLPTQHKENISPAQMKCNANDSTCFIDMWDKSKHGDFSLVCNCCIYIEINYKTTISSSISLFEQKSEG